MRATLWYTLLRLGLFVAAAGLMYVAGLRGVLMLGLALLASGAASYVLLTRQRDNIARSITGRITSVRERLDAGTSAEDRD